MTAGNKGLVELWDIRTSKVKNVYTINTGPIVYGAKFYDEGKSILLGLNNGNAMILNNKLEIVKEWQICSQPIRSIEVADNICFYGLKGGCIKLDYLKPVSRQTFQTESSLTKLFGSDQNLIQAHKDNVNTMAYSKKKDTLITGSRDGSVHFFDVNNNMEFIGNGVGLIDQISAISVDPKEELVAVSSWDQTIAVYSL